MKQDPDQSYFTTREHAILARYFGLHNLRPNEAADPKLLKEYDPEEWDESQKGLAVLSGYNEQEPYTFDPETVERDSISMGDPFPSSLEAAVARFCFSKVRTPPRKSLSGINTHKKHFEILSIGTVDWGGGGFGSSWPEKYFIARIPYYSRWVVLALRDSIDSKGFEEYAIYHASADQPPKEVAQQAIDRYWRHNLTFNQPVFTSIESTGLLTGSELASIAASVWSKSAVPDESYEEFVKRTGFDLRKDAEARREEEF
jgi:hypothetical protein